MSKEFKGKIELDERDSTPDWEPYLQPVAPAGAPSVLYIVLDDVGFSSMEPWGGLIETPNINKLADAGLTYTNWHTTALCSPTRSSLLTGRNHTTNGMACIAEATTGYPNANGHIPFECATLAEVLGERGWNTYMLGKWHLVASDEMNMASTKRNWPVGRGFERYYGFLGGETNQWYPDLIYDNHPVDQPAMPEDGYHLTTDLTDKAIEFVKDAKSIAPDKPFFMYFCPGACHAPHHAPKEWIEKYKGKFDMGYEAYRELVFERQKKLGIFPENAELTPLNPYAEEKSVDGKPWPPLDVVRPWDSLSDEEKKLFCRMAEVFAGFLSHRPRDRAVARLPRRGRAPRRTRSWCSFPTTAPRAKAVRTARSTRTSSSTGSRTRSSRTSSTSTSSARPRPTTTIRSAGPGRSTRRSRCGSATTSRAVWPTRCSSPGRGHRREGRAPAPVPACDRHRADDLRPPRCRAARGRQGVRADSAGGCELPLDLRERRRADAEGVGVLLDARLPCRLEGRVEGSERPPDDRRLGPLRRGSLGALPHRRGPDREPRSRGREPREAQGADRPLVPPRRPLQRPAADGPDRGRGAGRTRPGRRSPLSEIAMSTTRTRPRSPRPPRSTSGTAATRSRSR